MQNMDLNTMYNQLALKLETLKQQLLAVRGNSIATSNIQNQINECANQLAGVKIQIEQTQAGMYNQPQNGYGYPQNNMMPQNNMVMPQNTQYGIPIVQQGGQYPTTPNSYAGTPYASSPYNQNGNNGFGTANVNNQQQNGGPSTNMGSKYGKRNSKTPIIQTPDMSMTMTNETNVPQAPTVELIPYEGYEFTPLLANGVTVEKAPLGEYFKYVYKGNVMNKINLAENDILINKYSEGGDYEITPKLSNGYLVHHDTLNYLKALSVENNKRVVGIDTFNAVDVMVPEESTMNFKSIVDGKKFEEIRQDLINKLAAAKSFENDFLLEINMIITAGINNVIKNVIGKDVSIDSFIEDYNLLVEYISDSEISLKNSLNENLEKFRTTLDHNAEMNEMIETYESMIETKSFKTTPIFYKNTIIYISDKELSTYVNSCVVDETFMITKESFGELHGVLENLFSKLVFANTSNHAKVIFNNIIYDVYKNAATGYFTIRK